MAHQTYELAHRNGTVLPGFEIVEDQETYSHGHHGFKWRSDEKLFDQDPPLAVLLVATMNRWKPGDMCWVERGVNFYQVKDLTDRSGFSFQLNAEWITGKEEDWEEIT